MACCLLKLRCLNVALGAEPDRDRESDEVEPGGDIVVVDREAKGVGFAVLEYLVVL